MSRAHLSIRPGGVAAAIRHYQHSPTPNLIILETGAAPDAVLSEIDALSTVCDVATRVIVIGTSNDIDFYRQLMKRGVSEYVRTPVDATSVIAAISGVFSAPGETKLGRLYAFIGARGGVGSSTIAHNVALALGRCSGAEVLLADMDLAFGTASLNFGLEPTSGIADAVRDVGRLDEQMLERLLTRCDDHLSLLAAPPLPEDPFEIDAGAVDAVLDLAQARASHVVLDLPHVWTGWSKRTLVAADEVVITASPDLASLKHAKHLLDVLRQARPHDPEPRLVLNQVGIPKRPEISPDEFAGALQLEPVISVPFDARAFGAAANNGRLLSDGPRRRRPAAEFHRLAETLSGRTLSGGRGSGLLARLFRRSKAAPRKP